MKHISLIVTFLILTFQVFSQDANLQDKITLNNGEVYKGEIILKNNDMVMLKTDDGTRYQFQLSEIKSIEKEPASIKVEPEAQIVEKQEDTSGNISGIIELAGGTSSAKNLFGNSPNLQISLIFGDKNAFGQNLFLGVGIGLNNTFLTQNSPSLSLLPIFVRIQKNLTNTRLSPILGMDAGYSFCVTKEYDGGAMIKIFAGIIYKLNYKSSIFANVYGGINSIAGNLIETNELGTFSYHGNTALNSVGIKFGLQF